LRGKKAEELKRQQQKEEPKETEKEKEEKEENKLAEGKLRPGVGNGGSTDKYTWTQNDIKEININIPVPDDTRGKDVKVNFDAKNLFVSVKNEVIMDGEMCALIKPDSLIWAVDEVRGKKIHCDDF